MMNSVKAIKHIDKIIGPVLLKLFPKAYRIDSKNIALKKILVIRPGGMGDALLLLPVLKEIVSLFNIKIDILCEPRNKPVFKSVSFINTIFSYQNPKSMLSVFQNKYDAVFDTEQSHFLSAIITRFVRADIRAGFKTMGREKMYNKTIEYSHDIYEAKMFWKLFSAVFKLETQGEDPFHFDFPFFTPPMHNLNLPFKDEKIIFLFPGATIDERLWPEKRWAKVMDRIADTNFKPVLIGGSKEYNQCKKIIAYCKTDKGENLCNKFSIIETAELFKRAELLISTDSGILHLGVLCDIPTISLFGSGMADKWAPKGAKHITINKNLECSPCTKFGTTPPCPNGKKCMLKITPEDVINNIKQECGLFL